MWPDGIVECLYVSKYIRLGVGPGGIVLEVDQLALEAAEEIFCHGVVIGIAFAGHALPDSIGLQALLEGDRSVLDAPVTVKDEVLGRFTAAYCHVEGFQSQGSVDTAGKGIAHNFSGTQVLDDGQVEPAFPGRNVGDIAHPGLIWVFKIELSLQKVRRRRMAVPGVGCDLIGPASCRNDPSNPHLTVDPLAGTAEFRLEHVVEAVQPQGRILLVQLHQSPPQRLIALLPPARFRIPPLIVTAA